MNAFMGFAFWLVTLVWLKGSKALQRILSSDMDIGACGPGHIKFLEEDYQEYAYYAWGVTTFLTVLQLWGFSFSRGLESDSLFLHIFGRLIHLAFSFLPILDYNHDYTIFLGFHYRSYEPLFPVPKKSGRAFRR